MSILRLYPQAHQNMTEKIEVAAGKKKDWKGNIKEPRAILKQIYKDKDERKTKPYSNHGCKPTAS